MYVYMYIYQRESLYAAVLTARLAQVEALPLRCDSAFTLSSNSFNAAAHTPQHCMFTVYMNLCAT
jgi:hypothetical protein